MADWFTVEGGTPEEATAAQERLVAAWEDAPLDNLEVCGMLLSVAREQVEAYAPAIEDLDEAPADPEDIPSRYVYAQLQQAKTLWNAGRVNSAGDVGMDGFVFTPRPLDKTIRQIIRPMEGRFNVG